MKTSIHTEIIINGPAELVWEQLVDLDSYQHWNPFIRYAEGQIALNETLVCKPVLPDSKRQMMFKPTITRCVDGVEFAWLGGIVIHPFIAGGEHSFQIHKLSENQVKLVHNQYFLGITSPLIKLVAGEKTKRGFIAMNKALKERVENLVAKNRAIDNHERR